MKTIIAGSRENVTYSMVKTAVLLSGFEMTEVVSGTARGADKLGERYAVDNNIPVKRMPANWDLHGKSAGYKRNAEMAAYADACILIWDGCSPGSKSMRDLAIKNKLKLYVYIFDQLLDLY